MLDVGSVVWTGKGFRARRMKRSGQPLSNYLLSFDIVGNIALDRVQRGIKNIGLSLPDHLPRVSEIELQQKIAIFLQ